MAAAVEDLIMIAFDYLLWVGEYMVQDTWNDTKPSIQF